MKREEIEKILTEELGTMYPIEKHIAIIDRLLSCAHTNLSPVAGYVEVRCEDELPGVGDGCRTLSDDVFAILTNGESVIAYYDHINKTWAGMFNAKDTVKCWLKPATFPDTQEEWISVEDRLPTLEEHGSKVMIYRKVPESQSEMAMSVFDAAMCKYCEPGTKWMPLPKPPARLKEEGGEG